MNDPHSGEIPFLGAYLQTLFFQDGGQQAIVVTNRNGRRRQKILAIQSAEDALAWAKENRACMIYLPASGGQN